MKILYLGFVMPPALAGRYPKHNVAGQLWENRLLEHLGHGDEIRRVSILDRKIQVEGGDFNGENHACLVGKFSKDLQAPLSYLRLKKMYLRWRRAGWKPDCFLVYNTHPIGNAFTQFLTRTDPKIARILIYLDSNQFGRSVPPLKAIRQRLKPLYWSDESMLPCFHGVASASFASKRFCEERGIPWLWFPGGIQEDGLLKNVEMPPQDGPITIGYFGSHSGYAGLKELLAAFMQTPSPEIKLSIAGEGSKTEDLKKAAASDTRIEWVGFFDKREDLGRWASQCHVLVNPRPAGYGNENNFPSKIFDYVQLGRAVLSSKTGTLAHAFGDSVMWYDAHDPQALINAIQKISQVQASELLEQGRRLSEWCKSRYSWTKMAQEIKKLIDSIKNKT